MGIPANETDRPLPQIPDEPPPEMASAAASEFGGQPQGKPQPEADPAAGFNSPEMDPLLAKAVKMCSCPPCDKGNVVAAFDPKLRHPDCKAQEFWAELDGVRSHATAVEADLRQQIDSLRGRDSSWADKRERNVLYVLPEQNSPEARRDQQGNKFEGPANARIVDQVPLARLTDDCSVCAFVDGEMQTVIPVSKYWDNEAQMGVGMVVTAPFLEALGKTCAPLGVRVRNGMLSLVWA